MKAETKYLGHMDIAELNRSIKSEEEQGWAMSGGIKSAGPGKIYFVVMQKCCPEPATQTPTRERVKPWK